MAAVYENITHPQLIAHLGGEDVGHIVTTQVGVANYLLPPDELPQAPDRTYAANDPLWRAILGERLRATVTITLQDFFLSEWFPRSPGLFYTQEARFAREEAMYFIRSAPAGVKPGEADEQKALQNAEVGYSQPGTPDYMYIFDPYGKSRMIKGGIGCIRLKDKLVGSERLWFMSASSSPVAHEGFPVAVPDDLYGRHIERIASAGAIPCTLTGKLRFLPEPFVKLFEEYTGVPQFYLAVEELTPATTLTSPEGKPFRVSVPVSFQSDYEGTPGMYASYVTFLPGTAGSFESRLDWLENTYVRGMYQGRIVTDFDEQTVRFRGAVFSLDRVMNNTLDRGEVRTFVNTMHVYAPADMLIEQVDRIFARRVDHMTQERVINIGAGANVTAPVVIADRIENSFNAVAASPVDDEIKKLLKDLILQVNEIGKSTQASPETADQMARDAETLAKEVTSSKPRRQWYEISLEGLKQAAVNIGEVGKPVIETVAKLLPLLLQAFPG